MSGESKSDLRLKTAHVLFINIAGYSKLLIDAQSEALHELNQVVRNGEAEAALEPFRLPASDGNISASAFVAV